MKFRHIPLYKQINAGSVAADNKSDGINPVLYVDSNYGLLFDKFFDAYAEDFTPLKKNEYQEAVNHKQLFLKEFLYRYDYDNEQVAQSFSNYEKDLKNLKQSHYAELRRLEDRIRRANGRNNPNSSLITDINKLEGHIDLDTQYQENLDKLREQQQNRCVTTNTKLADHRRKQQNLIVTLEGQSKIYQLDGHFVTGMGNSHPIENGFSWHHTLGVPYLSGSQVKGLVRAVIEQFYPEDASKEKIMLKWLGSKSKNAQENQVGELIFFDALPTKKPELSVDIMTPHMGDWYEEGGKITNIETDGDKIPADWHDPKPIPFLAVKNASFLFSIAKRPESNIEIKCVFECLDHALTYLGAGAKTQTGYGYMLLNTRDTENLKQLTRPKNIFTELEDDIKNHHWGVEGGKHKNIFYTDGAFQWIEKLEQYQDKSSDENFSNAVKLLFCIIKLHYPNAKNRTRDRQKEMWSRIQELRQQV